MYRSLILRLGNVIWVGSWVAPNELIERGDCSAIEALARDAASMRRSS